VKGASKAIMIDIITLQYNLQEDIQVIELDVIILGVMKSVQATAAGW
jgi:hypothetical protein